MQELRLRKAESEEIGTVLRLLREAALWLRDQGIDYWQNWIPNPPQYGYDWLKQGFTNSEFMFALDIDDTIIGCFRLQDQDPMFWGERTEKAGYVHSFTVARERAGQGIGYRILSRIETICRREGKEYLRLDCGSHIPKLRNYYEEFGFTFAGNVDIKGEFLTLYEKSLTGQ